MRRSQQGNDPQSETGLVWLRTTHGFGEGKIGDGLSNFTETSAYRKPTRRLGGNIWTVPVLR